MENSLASASCGAAVPHSGALFLVVKNPKIKNKLLITLLSTLLVLSTSISCVLFFPSGGDIKFDPDTLPNAQVNTRYEAEIHVTENRTPVGDFAISDGDLPAGLELQKVEGVEDTARITGVPVKSGTSTFKISVWCYGTNVSGQTGEMEYSIVVKP